MPEGRVVLFTVGTFGAVGVVEAFVTGGENVECDDGEGGDKVRA